ncbi:AAA family ATPase [Micromonospora sp. 4G55]|uniref:AAA family ATPase n=1 Tax=Micromonospora sp. 4G55 TaxID=2806102 RepID=UPI001A569060|nr:AAA family ATPase [Micromonospora sp. 4G55]MBM0255531.1 AAA family ATPase [Micromonospora sp. 4G55]
MSTTDERQFVGRDSELAVVGDFLSSDPQVRVLAFWGQSGIGKSALLRHIASRVRGWRVRLLDLEATDLPLADAGGPSALTDGLLFGLARLLLSSEGEAGERRLRTFEERASRAARDHLTPTTDIRLSQSASFGGQVRDSHVHVHGGPVVPTAALLAYRRSIVRALLDQARAAGSQRMVLLVDTVELMRLADERNAGSERLVAEPSLGLSQWFVHEFLPELVDAAPGLRVVLAGRDRLPGRDCWFRQAELAEWTPAETAGYLAANGYQDPAFATVVHELCAGVPLWTAMVVEACALWSGSREPTADWLRSVAHSRPTEQWLPEVFLARLPAVQRQVVRCAVIPRQLSLELVHHLLELSGVDVPNDWWDRFCRHSFVRTATATDTTGRRHVHRMVRAVVLMHLERQEPLRLSKLHRAAAEYHHRTGNLAEESYHRFAAADYDILPRWRNALFEARRRRDLEEIVRLVDCVTAPEQRHRIARVNRALLAEGQLQFALLGYTEDDYEAAEQRLRVALHEYRALGDESGQSKVHNWLATVRCYQGDYRAAEEHGWAALLAGRRAEDIGMIRDAHSTIAMNYGEWGRWRGAIGHYAATIRLSRQLGEPMEESNHLCQLSSTLRAMGEGDAASRYLARAEAVARLSGDPGEISFCLYSRGWQEIHCGRPAAALAPLEESLRLTRPLGRPLQTAWALRPLALAYLLLGQGHRAGPYVDEALDTFEQLGYRVGLAHINSLRALVMLAAGRLESAEAAARDAERLIRARPASHITGWVRLVDGAVRAVADQHGWAEHLRETLLVDYRHSHAYGSATDLLLIAGVLHAQRESQAARRFLQYALAHARYAGHRDSQHQAVRLLEQVRATVRR